MSYQLYYSPGAASMAVHWMLLEIGVPFEIVLVDIDSGAQQTPEYRRLNPAGRVPTLVVDGVPHVESTALLILLAERHPEAELMPPPGSMERANWLEMMVYLANTLLPAMRDWFYAEKDGDPAGADAVRHLARRRIEAAWDHLDERVVVNRSYLVGDQLSTADFLAMMMMRWSRHMPRPATTWPNLNAYIQRLANMSSFIEVNRRESLEGWPMLADTVG
ncbi:glutathione S-transferase family protein [Dipodascopsis uninucleata]